MSTREMELARQEEALRVRQAELDQRARDLDRTEAKANWPFCTFSMR